MAKFDKSVLEKYGITGTTEVVYNPSYEVLFEEETKASLEGFEKGQVTELGAVNVMTGVYTGRSPKVRDAAAAGRATRRKGFCGNAKPHTRTACVHAADNIFHSRLTLESRTDSCR